MRQTDRTLAAELAAAEPGSTVTLRGHVHRRRELAAVTFLVVRDRTGLAQVVLRPEEVPDGGLPPEETAVEVTGRATPNSQAPGGVEVTAPTVTALTEPAQTPPVELWRPALKTGLPTLLDHAPVTWRHPAQRARWELAAASLRGFRRTLDDRGFTEVHSPKIVESVTESGANVFEIDYFGRPAYLAQSPQFYKQQLVGVFERVYEVGPVFRAEPHDTVRHLAGYVSLDVEPDLAPSTSARSGPGRWPSSAATCSPSRATRCASGRSTPTRSRPTRAGATASTCSSAASSW